MSGGTLREWDHEFREWDFEQGVTMERVGWSHGDGWVGGLGIARVAGGSGGRESRFERFGDLNDIDIMLPTIDWVGNLRIPNNKKIKWPEVICWSLDVTGVERHSEGDYDCENIAFGDIESY